MHRFHLFILAAWLLLSVFACRSSKNMPSFNEKNKAMSLEKGSCLGKCAVYSLTIYKNKYALYEGRFNTDKPGKHYKLLPDSVYENLNIQFEKASFDGLDSLYPSDIADFPTIVLGYYLGKKAKTITYKENKPESLSVIQKKLEQVANSFDWIAMQKTKENIEYKPMDAKRMQDDGIYIKNEIIIEPSDGMDIEKCISSYEGYKLASKGKIAPNFNYYLLTWNTEIISPDEMLAKLKSDKCFKTAEFNKKIMQRDH